MARRFEVFACSANAVQLIWRGRGAGSDLVEVAHARHTIDVDRDIGAITVTGLEPATTHELVVNGRRLRTFTTAAQPAGRLLGRVATLSDLHVGEVAVGHWPRVWSRRRTHEWRDAHPIWCLEAAADEVAQWAPDLLVVKGDLAHNNLPGEYDAVAKILNGVGRPVLGMPGNHDGGHVHRSDFAAEIGRVGLGPADPIIVHDFGDARVVAVDTRIEGEHAGTIGALTPEVVARAAEASGPVLVLLHHQFESTRVPYYLPRGIPYAESVRFLDALHEAAPGSLVSSGHTHRNRVRTHRSVTVTEVGSPKDFPGTWGAYELYEGGILQTAWRVAEPRALAWTELTARTALHAWGRWANGRFEDRCVTVFGRSDAE